MDEIILKPLSLGDADNAAELLRFLNPETPVEVLRERLTTIFHDHPHYQQVGAFAGDKLVGLCGAWIATKIWCGKYLEIDNLVVHPQQRSGRIGTRLIEHFEALARVENCKLVTLGSYTSNYPSHRLYHRLGYEIWGYHFMKPLK